MLQDRAHRLCVQRVSEPLPVSHVRRAAMLNDLLRSLMGLLRKHAGSLLGLARKGLNSIRALLGGARGLLGPLIKRALSFLLGKLSPAMSSVRAQAKSSFASLMRMAEGVLKGEPSEAGTEDEEPEIAPERRTVTSTGAAAAKRVPLSPRGAAPVEGAVAPIEEATAAPSAARTVAEVEEPAAEPVRSAAAPLHDTERATPPADQDPGLRRPPHESAAPSSGEASAMAHDLTRLAPALRRALMRVRDRTPAAHGQRPASMLAAP